MCRNSDFRRRAIRQSGTAMLLGALVIFVMFAFMGLALDASYLYFQKRRMQTAADAGAYAAALERLRGNTSVTTAARKDVALNGFTHGVSSVDVAVNVPPTEGERAGNSQYIEVIVAQPQSTWFMRAVNFNSATVRARAVAGLGEANGCIFALNRDLSNTNNGFFANGTTDSYVSCGIYSNAHFRSVGGGCVVTTSVSYTGSYTNQNSGGACGPQGIQQSVPIVDPIAGRYTMPSSSTCDFNNVTITTGTTVTLNPGVYCGGITIAGSVTTVVFSPGTYILLGGGMHVTASASITGTSVTFINTFPNNQPALYGGITINGTGQVILTAPTSGSYKGLLFYQDPRVSWAANNGSTLSGAANSVYQGILYFPTTDLTYSGNSSMSQTGADGYTTLVGYNVQILGTSRINADYSAIGGNPFMAAMFAE
ncbi:MAG: hypothetical protein HYZ57_03175 [Acidobacteria bacterium]|nr:hypothetical protein [Acidobacteriota bacterium]